jgi:NADH dehydrogenase FAD-containing subunit
MTKQLVLLGAGLAHVCLLARLAQQPLVGVQVTLVTPQPRLIYSGMLAGFVAGQHALDDSAIALEPLVQQSGARWMATQAVELDAQARVLRLMDGTEVNFDWLSLCQEPVQDRDALERALPGARQHGLFVRPLEAFCTLWPRVPELAATQPLRVAVVGGAGGAEVSGEVGSGVDPADKRVPSVVDAQASHALATELALAIRQRLPGSAVTLVTGGAPLAHGCDPALQKRLAQALRQRNVTVLADCATHIDSGEVTLASGARLACDVPLLATRPNLPRWLAGCGLALDSQGLIAVDACGRSTSHPHVFATGQASAGLAFESARSLSARASSVAANLAAAVTGQPVRAPVPAANAKANAVRLVPCGDGQAIMAWRGYSASGRWAGWLKDRMDRTLIAQCRTVDKRKGL